MKKDLHQRVLETIEQHRMIRAGERVGMGVSAGADSVALLRIFSALRERLGVNLLVLHFHHQLRGADADRDQEFAGQLASALGIEFVAGSANVAAEARRNRWNLEDAARRLRYQFFHSAATAHRLDRIAVAHTADDQAETVLAHILRGTGITGLAGIHPVAGVVIRPLLEIRRRELRAYLSGINQDWREDATNQDVSRTRARIRHNLLPMLEREFEPAVVPRLARLAGLAREEESFWQAIQNERFAALVRQESSAKLSIRAEDLLSPHSVVAPISAENADVNAASTAVSRRLVRRICRELRGSRCQLTARHVNDVLGLASKSQSGARIELPGIVVERVFDRLIFASAPGGKRAGISKESSEFEYAISSPNDPAGSSIAIPEIKRRFSLKVVDWSARSRETIIEQGTLDFDSLRWPLTLRNWHPGDSYRPHRRLRAHKLKQLLLEARIPPSDRTGWPVFICDGELVWAPRCPPAEKFAASSVTRSGLVIAEVDF